MSSPRGEGELFQLFIGTADGQYSLRILMHFMIFMFVTLELNPALDLQEPIEKSCFAVRTSNLRTGHHFYLEPKFPVSNQLRSIGLRLQGFIEQVPFSTANF